MKITGLILKSVLRLSRHISEDTCFLQSWIYPIKHDHVVHMYIYIYIYDTYICIYKICMCIYIIYIYRAWCIFKNRYQYSVHQDSFKTCSLQTILNDTWGWKGEADWCHNFQASGGRSTGEETAGDNERHLKHRIPSQLEDGKVSSWKSSWSWFWVW